MGSSKMRSYGFRYLNSLGWFCSWPCIPDCEQPAYPDPPNNHGILKTGSLQQDRYLTNTAIVHFQLFHDYGRKSKFWKEIKLSSTNIEDNHGRLDGGQQAALLKGLSFGLNYFCATCSIWVVVDPPVWQKCWSRWIMKPSCFGVKMKQKCLKPTRSRIKETSLYLWGLGGVRVQMQ